MKCEFYPAFECHNPQECRQGGCGRESAASLVLRKPIPTDPVIEAVRADLLRRQQLGYKKYGGTLAENPAQLHEKLQHAYEESLDLCNYLKWIIMQLTDDPALKPDPTHRVR